MPEFQFVTKSNQNPRDLQKVYFTCHPDDFDNTYKEIEKEIFSRQNVAIWYLEPGVKPEDVADYELQLGMMNLLVVPVTAKLLNMPNRAMDTEVPFALEKHIPVLPLMQEGGLDALYTQKFGDLQYLDKNNSDPTAIPYEEKLTKYLDSVIIGDKTAQQIREAFDAYIFLSYRKKDRAYAQELMKLIHANQFCRDIAIWYDEFLTPGEDFNDAIKAALKKSKLFALTVTPNLLEMPGGKPNFVMDQEYPAAKEANKPVFAAEMIKTDAEKLKEKYADIPETIRANDHNGIKEQLSAMIQKLAITANDKDPQHNFFIGLAYLSGIDVEKNYPRAHMLINGASNQGYIPATKKLISMYTNGEGVERDYEEVADWMETLVEQCKEAFSSSRDFESAKDVLNAEKELGDILFHYLEQNEAAQRVYTALCNDSETYEEVFSGNLYERLILLDFQNIGYERLGKISQKQFRISDAEAYYAECADREAKANDLKRDVNSLYSAFVQMVRERIEKENPGLTEEEKNALLDTELEKERNDTRQNKAKTPYLNRNEIMIQLNNGDLAVQKGEIDTAERLYKKALKLLEDLEDSLHSREYYRRDLAMVYEKLGEISAIQNQSQEAASWYKKSLRVLRSLAAETRSLEDRQALSHAYFHCGETALKQENFPEAENRFFKCLVLTQELCKEYDVLRTRRLLILIHIKLAEVALSQNGKLNEAAKKAEGCYPKAKKLADETGWIKDRGNLAVLCQYLGIIAAKKHQKNEADRRYQECIAIQEEIVKEAGTPESYDALAYFYYNYGKDTDRIEPVEQALSIWTQLAQLCPQNPNYKGNKELVIDYLMEKNHENEVTISADLFKDIF